MSDLDIEQAARETDYSKSDVFYAKERSVS